MLLTTTISAVLVLALSGLADRAISAWQYSHDRQELVYQGNFAMSRMIATLRKAGSITTPPDNTPGALLEVVLDLAVDPVPAPVRYQVTGNNTLHETMHGQDHIIAQAPRLTLQVTRLTPVDANGTQVELTITLGNSADAPLTFTSEVMLGVGG